MFAVFRNKPPRHKRRFHLTDLTENICFTACIIETSNSKYFLNELATFVYLSANISGDTRKCHDHEAQLSRGDQKKER